jgi:aquaporin Z
MLGTALLLLIALSVVILMFGSGGTMEQLIPNIGHRRLITGFPFGSIHCLV